MSLKFILPFLLACLPPALFCQNYGSCETALEICSKGLIEVKYHKDSIRAAPDDKTGCLGGVFESTWLTWEIVEDGYLSFTIIPEFMSDDIDFAVFKLVPGKDCRGKKLIRCALSGENVGAPLEDYLPCIGLTGLTTAEPRETREDMGCHVGKNNFLAALDCKKGERYALAFQDFRQAAGRVLIDFCGSAGLPCDTIICEELTRKKNRLPQKQMVVFSTQISGKVFPLFFSGFQGETANVTIQDALGVAIFHEKIRLEDAEVTFEIPVEGLPPGDYRALIIAGGQAAAAGRFVKLK